MHHGRKRPVQLVVEDDEPNSAPGSKTTPGKAGDKSASNKKLTVAGSHKNFPLTVYKKIQLRCIV
jgi:hypothetical protein